MTVKLLAMYLRPDDPDAFLSHYRDVHTPLVRAVPGLKKLVVNHVDSTLIGTSPWFLIAELDFGDRADFETAMASQENRAVGKDLKNFAEGLVTLLTVHAAD